MSLYKSEEKAKNTPPPFLTYLARCVGILPGDTEELRMVGFQCSRHRVRG